MPWRRSEGRGSRGVRRVTTIEFFEKARLARNILPASVLDRSYGEQAEMTKQQVIEKSLVVMGRRWCWGDGSDEEAGYLSFVISELERRLPEGTIKTCGCFRHLDAACCHACHTLYPHHTMSLLELPDGGMAWVCHQVEDAIHACLRSRPRPRRHAPSRRKAAKALGAKQGSTN